VVVARQPLPDGQRTLAVGADGEPGAETTGDGFGHIGLVIGGGRDRQGRDGLHRLYCLLLALAIGTRAYWRLPAGAEPGEKLGVGVGWQAEREQHGGCQEKNSFHEMVPRLRNEKTSSSQCRVF
jgi:hypothetical protein